jgi:hypothetical protein
MKTRRRKKPTANVPTVRYRPIMARMECTQCGHWGICAAACAPACRNVEAREA